MADLKAQRLRLAITLQRQRLVKEMASLLPTDEAREVFREHADVVRARCRRIPGRAAASLADRYGLTGEDRAGLERLIGGEVELALEELRDDPLERGV